MQLKVLLLFLICPFFVFAQDPDPSGEWEGYIQTPQMNLGVEIDLEKASKKDFAGTMSVPMQQLKGLPLTDVEWDRKEQKLSFKVPDVPGNSRFKGTLSANGDSLIGFWSQGMASMPMAIGRPSAEEQAEMETNQAETLAEFRLFADSLLDALDVPGMSVAIVKDGEVILAEGFGYRNVEKETPVDAETRFAIGSCSKAFTAFGLGVLAEEGKLDWDTPVREYMPDFKLADEYVTQNATAIDLMTHRTGLPRHDFAWYGSVESREELFSRLPHLPMNESFRNKWQYQNFMFMTAGILAGRLDNSSWEEVIQSRIFGPLGMDQSTLHITGLSESDNAALGYAYDSEAKAFKLLPYRNIDAIGPAGSINSNANDMAKWLQVFLDGGQFNGERIVSAKTLNRLRTSYIPTGNPGRPGLITPPAYGLGWMVYHYRGLPAIEHGGNIDGFSAAVFMLPEENFGAVVLTNKNGTNATSAAAYQAADMLLDLDRGNWIKVLGGGAGPDDGGDDFNPGKAEPIAGTTPSHDLKDYVGTYAHPGYGEYTIAVEGDSLYGMFNGQRYNFQHWHYDIFKGKAEFAEFLFNFSTNNDGYIQSFTVPFEPSVDPIRFHIVPPAYLSDSDFIDRLPGVYNMQVTEVTVSRSGDHLVIEAPGQPPFDLEPVRGTTYRFKGLEGFNVTFDIDPAGKGKAAAVTISQPNVVLTGDRKE